MNVCEIKIVRPSHQRHRRGESGSRWNNVA